jgi:hypothetical protein
MKTTLEIAQEIYGKDSQFSEVQLHKLGQLIHLVRTDAIQTASKAKVDKPKTRYRVDTLQAIFDDAFKKGVAAARFAVRKSIG